MIRCCLIIFILVVSDCISQPLHEAEDHYIKHPTLNNKLFDYFNDTTFNNTMFNHTFFEHPTPMPILSPVRQSPSISPVVESHYRMWIYTELYSSSVCASSSAEYAFGVSSESCVSQSPLFETLFALFDPLVKSFKIEGTDCSSTRLRLYEDPTCEENDAVPRYLEDEVWNSVITSIGQCSPDFTDTRYTVARYHSRLICTPIVEDKLPTLNFDAFVASGYPEYFGLDMQESCLYVLPATFVAIPSDQCDSNIPPFLLPSFPSLLTTPLSAYEFDCSDAETLGIATEYEYLQSDTCDGPGRATEVPLNVCREETLNPRNSEPRESQHPRGRRLKEEVEEVVEEDEFETSVFINLAGYQNATMLNISIYGELNITAMENITYYSHQTIPFFNLTVMENITHFAYNNISNYNAENITLFNNFTNFNNITHFHNVNFNNFTQFINVTNFNNVTISNNFNQFNLTVVENMTYFQNNSLYANVTIPEPEFNYTQVFNYTMFNNVTANITMFENLTFYSNVTQYLNASDIEHHHINVTIPTYLYYYVKYSCVNGNQTKTASPIPSPTVIPTRTPTRIRTLSPSVVLTHEPSTRQPSAMPTANPSDTPTIKPTFIPSVVPSFKPSAIPTYKPSREPSGVPTFDPTTFPTEEPSFEPFEIESTFSPTEEPTVKAGETRAPKPPPTRAPSAAPTFQLFPVISFSSQRSMTLDTASVNSLQSKTGPLPKIMCDTQLKSQGLTTGATCSLEVAASRRALSANMLSGLASLLGFPTGDFFNHFRGAASNTPVKIDFTTEINMVNHQDVSLSTLLGNIVQSSQTFSPNEFKATLTKQAQATGLKVAVSGVSPSAVAADSFVVAAPPTFSPTTMPTTSTPNVAPSAKPSTSPTSTASPSTTPAPSLQPSAGADKGSSESGLSVGAIVGIAVGAFVLVILVAVGVVYYLRVSGNKPKVYAEQ